VRVHQIWMGDRADDAKAASYTAQDVMIIERDVGRLAKYNFDMGGSGDLLALALSVPPWKPLHELTPAELSLTNLVTDVAIADVKPDATVSGTGERPIRGSTASTSVAEVKSAPIQPNAAEPAKSAQAE